jgi:hypothetical protein
MTALLRGTTRLQRACRRVARLRRIDLHDHKRNIIRLRAVSNEQSQAFSNPSADLRRAADAASAEPHLPVTRVFAYYRPVG